MRAIVLMSLLALAGCAVGPQEDIKITRLADGATEIALPYGTAQMVLESSGYQTEYVIAAKAKAICHDGGYTIDPMPIRKRAEYADPEKVWIVRCATETTP